SDGLQEEAVSESRTSLRRLESLMISCSFFTQHLKSRKLTSDQVLRCSSTHLSEISSLG
ncbi:uncharacterized, partial [Tachysurus ichikawai]